MTSPLLAALAVLAAAPPSEGLRAESADLALPLPGGWRFEPSTMKTAASIPVAGEKCINRVWFDFIPGASRELTRKLIDTESLRVTMAIRAWDERRETEVAVGGRPAARIELPRLPERSIYVLATAGGSLVIHLMAQGDVAVEKCAPKHPEAAATLAGLFFAPEVLARAAQLSKSVKPPTPKKLEPVPTNLEECFAALEKKLSKEDLEKMRKGTERDLSAHHFGLGAGMRNAWGLWGASPLARYFNGLGIHHADDMSSIILTSFWRHLNGQPIELEKQVAFFGRYWAVRRPPDPKACADGTPSKSLFQLEGRAPARDKVVSVFACDAQGTYWAWELDRGWYEPDEKLRKRIAKLRREAPGLASGPLEE